MQGWHQEPGLTTLRNMASRVLLPQAGGSLKDALLWDLQEFGGQLLP